MADQLKNCINQRAHWFYSDRIHTAGSVWITDTITNVMIHYTTLYTSVSSLITCVQLLNLTISTVYLDHANGGSKFWSFFPWLTDKLDAVSKLNKRTSAWWDNFVSETVVKEDWRLNVCTSRRSPHKLTDELRVNPDTYAWTGKCNLNTDTCGRGNFWIRKEKFADSKISGYIWTGP